MNTPIVGIIMGSDSDLPIMSEAAIVLESFGVTVEVSVVSAHRTPDEAADYAKTAKERGLKVIIAGAGGAAHLAGVIAAMTTLPVIAVPIKGKSLEGLDSLLSMVQMPPGIPVATVGINAGKNAGLLAAAILSTSSEEITKKLENYREEMRDGVTKKAAALKEKGFKAYGGELKG
jgi:5-(carboxyamino)imidazole ribonucleotide mutase